MTQRLTKVYTDVLGLTMGEKRDLYGMIKNILENDQKKVNLKTYEDRIISTIEKVLGEPMSYTDRHFPHTTARQIVAWQAMTDGFSSNVAAKLLKKNHTSVIWMRNKVDDILKYPWGYEKEIDLINGFKNAWNNGVQ